MITQSAQTRTVPILLYDGGCETCSHIARWVQRSADTGASEHCIIVRPVGNDPEELQLLNPALDIWDAYEVIHVIMPDGSMKIGGEAVAEVLRCLPRLKWMTPCFDLKVLGVRPFQKILNLAYLILDDIRPILGCESCGRSKFWVRPIERLSKWAKIFGGKDRKSGAHLHFKPLPVAQPHAAKVST